MCVLFRVCVYFAMGCVLLVVVKIGFRIRHCVSVGRSCLVSLWCFISVRVLEPRCMSHVMFLHFVVAFHCSSLRVLGCPYMSSRFPLWFLAYHCAFSVFLYCDYRCVALHVRVCKCSPCVVAALVCGSVHVRVFCVRHCMSSCGHVVCFLVCQCRIVLCIPLCGIACQCVSVDGHCSDHVLFHCVPVMALGCLEIVVPVVCICFRLACLDYMCIIESHCMPLCVHVPCCILLHAIVANGMPDWLYNRVFPDDPL